MIKQTVAAVVGSLSFGLLVVIGYNVVCVLAKTNSNSDTGWTIFWICAALGMVIALFEGDWGD